MPATPENDPDRDHADDLPIDPDLDDSADGGDAPRPARAVHLTPRYIGLVGAGGAVGTAARYLITVQAGDAGIGTAMATLIINVVGCLLIGVLLELLARLGPDHGRRRAIRLLLGTGVLGGFTTYSTLAEVVASAADAGRITSAVGYGLVSLLLGLLACASGIALAGLHRRGTVAGP